MIRAIKLCTQVLLVMTLTACMNSPVQRTNLEQAKLSISLASSKALQSHSSLPLPYAERADRLLGAAYTEQHRGNYNLADKYAKMALSEARVALAASETSVASLKKSGALEQHRTAAE